MTQICWWLVSVVSRALEPGERDAVQGDLVESGETGSQALREVLGLVARRQAALWKHPRPWLALAGLVVPLGLSLSLISRHTAHNSAIYVWLYANNWDSALLESAAFRHLFARYVAAIAIEYTTIFCWSWTTGFVLAWVSRSSVPVNGFLFGLAVLSGELLVAPLRHLGHVPFYGARDFHSNDAVFDLVFYRVIFPLIVQGALVLAPSLWGMRQGLRAERRTT